MNLLFLLREIATCIKKRMIVLIVFITLFGIGLFSGIVIDKPNVIECYYLNYCDNYVYRIFSESPGGIFLDRISGSAIFILLVFPLALSVFCVPLQAFLVFYKGFVFGSVTVILFSVYRFSGFLIWLVILLPQTLLFAAIYVVLSVLAFDCGCESRTCGNLAGIRNFIIYAAAAFVAALLCALFEFLVVCLLFRPLSKVL